MATSPEGIDHDGKVLIIKVQHYSRVMVVMVLRNQSALFNAFIVSLNRDTDVSSLNQQILMFSNRHVTRRESET